MQMWVFLGARNKIMVIYWLVSPAGRQVHHLSLRLSSYFVHMCAATNREVQYGCLVDCKGGKYSKRVQRDLALEECPLMAYSNWREVCAHRSGIP